MIWKSWKSGNKLSLNAMKPQSTLICTKQRRTVLRNLKEELGIMNLGLQIENFLDWKYHTSVLSSKVSIEIGFLR